MVTTSHKVGRRLYLAGLLYVHTSTSLQMRQQNAKLIVLLYHYNCNTSTFKFYSATTKYKAPTGFGSFYRFGDNARFGNTPFGADKPTTSATSYLPGNTPASMDK